MGRRALGAVAIFTLLALALALFPRQGSGSHVDPQFVGYNASCSDLAPAGTTWNELEVDSVEDGTYSLGQLTVSLDVHPGGDRTTIDWSSNITIDGVFVKGGPGGNFYHYDLPTMADSELVPPLNPNSGRHFDPSHLLFCTATSLSTPTATAPPPVTETPTPSHTATANPTATPSTTPPPSPTPTADPSITPSLTPSPTETTVPGTATPGPSATPGPTETPDPTATPVPGHFSRIFLPAICVDCFVSPGEPNDTCAAAYPINPHTAYSFLPDDQHDWYRFDLNASADVEIRLEEFAPLAGQLAAYSGDSCQSARFLQNYGEPSREKILSLGQQPAGTYFLYVSNDGDLSREAFYRLIVETR